MNISALFESDSPIKISSANGDTLEIKSGNRGTKNSIYIKTGDRGECIPLNHNESNVTEYAARKIARRVCIKLQDDIDIEFVLDATGIQPYEFLGSIQNVIEKALLEMPYESR